MSGAKQGDPERRDRTLARLLAEALHVPRAPGGPAGYSACPDAESLAAYADRNLDAEETALWENHFAGCARCQQILAVLTVSSEEPLTDDEVQRFGRLVAAASVTTERGGATERKTIAMPLRRPTLWRWLAPAAGIAAALGLWIALRPAPPRGTAALTAENKSAQPSPSPNESQVAEANVPPPPAVTRREGEALQRNSPAVPQPRAAEKKQAAKQAQAPPSAPPQASATDRVAALAQPQRDLSAEALPAPKANGAASAAAPAAAPAPPQPAPAAPQSGAAGALSSDARGVQTFAARNQIAALAKTPAPPVVFASPDRSALWRIGLAGRIERSTDQGQTWQPQASGVTSDLLAGAAPSNKAAWVVGRAGVILRTTDGERWQRVASPERPVNGRTNGPINGPVNGRLDSAAVAATDWTGVEARDALHATVVSADRRLVTEDGGQTWKQQ